MPSGAKWWCDSCWERLSHKFPSPHPIATIPKHPIENDIDTSTEFEVLNSWLKTHELVVEGIAISNFELDPKGKLIPVP